MGFIHEDHGKIAVETRRESLKVHYDADWLRDRPITDLYAQGAMHPEFAYEDIADLIAALEQVRDRWANFVPAGKGG